MQGSFFDREMIADPPDTAVPGLGFAGFLGPALELAAIIRRASSPEGTRREPDEIVDRFSI